jgi:hypothetical protein
VLSFEQRLPALAAPTPGTPRRRPPRIRLVSG